ncbi:MAG: hypothetical protein GY761_10710 [Hyphomicrobiales bacterium]|nr:hypothetical protein [Hyphomicrobiales bacterium]
MPQNQAPDDAQVNDNGDNVNQHINYRRCSNCKHDKMEPVSRISETGFIAMTTFGQVYRCPECAAEVKIRAPASIISGSIFAAFVAAIGWLAFINGPYWYATHLSYFSLNSYEFYMVFIDLLVFVLYSLVAIYGAWSLWSEIILPIKTIVLHPATGENRKMNDQETAGSKKSRNMQLLAFFLFPLVVYIPLLGGIWLLDTAGIDVRNDETYKFIMLAGTFAFAIFLAKRFKVEFGLVFFGMVFWMATVVSIIFLM